MKTVISGTYSKPLKAHKRMKTKWSFVMLVSVITLFTAGGCASHLYNAYDASLAGKAMEQVATLSKSHQTIFGTMTENLQTMSQLEQNLYNEMGERETEIQARKVMRMTWSVLRDEFEEEGLVGKLSKEIESRIINIHDELLQAQGKKGRVTKSLEDANDELKSAKEILTGWNRQIAVLEKLIEVTPSIEQALSEVKSEADFKDKAVDVVKKVRSQLKDVKVSYNDADGNKKDDVSLEDEIPKLLDTGDALIGNSDFDSGKIIAGIRAIVSPEAPGLMVTVAALAKDLAEGERNGLLAEIDSLEKRLEVMNQANRLVDMAEKLATNALKMSEGFADGEKIIVTLGNLATADPNNILTNALLATQHYVTIAGPITANVQYALREDAYLQHLQSIEISRINTIRQEALVARGAEGLLAYHEGGARSKDVTEVVYGITQLSLLGWIGAKTDD